MKFQITFKSPDSVYDGIEQAAQSAADRTLCDGDSEPTPEDFKELKLSAESEIKDFLKKWIENNEYITIEFDTEAGTAIVQQN